VFPTLTGAVALVVVASLVHRIAPKIIYPLRP